MPGKDFDAERQFKTEEERTFKLRGQFFIARASVRPEVLVPFEEMDDDTPAAEALATIDELVQAMIVPDDDAFARYQAIRADETDPFTMSEMQDLALWLFEVTSGRPTERPSDSSSGPAETGTT